MKNLFSAHGGFFHEGTVSHGTMRMVDLLQAFAAEYERLAPFNERSLVRDAYAMADTLCGEGFDGDQETAGDILNDLHDALNRIAVEHGCRFGSHEGDGSDFGFWSDAE